MIKRFFRHLSLNQKLIGIMLFLSLSLMSVLVILYYQAEKQMYEEFQQQIDDLSKAIRVGVEEVTSSAGSTDEKHLQNYLNKLNAKGVKEISIISPSEKIISSSNPKNVGTYLTQKKKELIFKAELGQSVELGEDQTKHVYNVIIPVVAEDKQYGYIHLTFNMENYSNLMRENSIKRLVAAGLIFAVGILFSYILAKRYTKPIEDMAKAAQSVASGNLDTELRTDRTDEIGELTASFNHMVERLKEDRVLRERLRKAEHLSSIGQFSSSIAHEIKNPLNFISLSIDLIRDKYKPETEAEQKSFTTLISNIKKEIMRVSSFAESFLEYSKPLELKLTDTDILALIDDLVSLVTARAEQDKINLNLVLDPLPHVKADPEFIKTCLYNLVLNAFQAMPDGGELTIATGRNEDKYFISVSDTGGGISHENLSRIFEPFFSTKLKGLGLGLALTKNIVEEHGGKIQIHSDEGKGTTITMHMPFERKPY